MRARVAEQRRMDDMKIDLELRKMYEDEAKRNEFRNRYNMRNYS